MAAPAINSFLSKAYNSSLSPKDREEKELIIRTTEMVKIAAVATGVVCALLLAALPYLGVFCLLAPLAYGAYEIGTIASNGQNIFENFFKEQIFRAGLSERLFLMHLTERTFVARSIVKLCRPLD